MAYLTDQTILTPFFIDEQLPGLEALLEPGWRLNKPELPSGSKQECLVVINSSLANETTLILEKGDRPISIAGDCCAAIGVTAGIQRTGVAHALIWFDAHGDFNTWETTPSGFLGGMPLAMLVGRGEQTVLEALDMKPIDEESVVFTDGRDLDPEEDDALTASNIVHLRDVNDLLGYDLPELPLHIHFDTDILNPATAPAMNYLADGGPDLDQLQAVFRYLAETDRIMAVSVSTWNPALDSDGRTQRNAMEALACLLD
jgi:arginase